MNSDMTDHQISYSRINEADPESHYPIITILDFQLGRAIKNAKLTDEQDDNINTRELMEQVAAECEDLKYEVYKILDKVLLRYKTTGKYEPESCFEGPPQ